MGDNLTSLQKFWFSACIVWLVFIFVTYSNHFHSSAWSAIIILFVGLFPTLSFLFSLARRKYRDRLVSHRHQPRNENAAHPPVITQNMISAIMIPPEPREPPHRSLMRNLGVDSLVTFLYQKDGKGEENECVVCLGQLEQGEMVAKLQFCSHLFHEKCIDPWLRQHKTCPICRSRVDHMATKKSMERNIAGVV